MTFFDELIGPEPDDEERARLRRVHNLLLEAGPPPELTPQMEAGPNTAMTLSRTRAYTHRRRHFALTAAAAVLVAIAVGIAATSHGHGNRYPTFSLRGTIFAPQASGKIELLPSKGSRARMKLEVNGLPALKTPYVVYLVRDGRPVAACGSFTVSTANRDLTKVLVSPYRFKNGDEWIVTQPRNDSDGPGPTVLQQQTA